MNANNALLIHLEAMAERGSDEVYTMLRKLSVDQVGRLLLDVPTDFPSLRQILPTMASEEIQRQWTGNAGLPLLQQSIAFVQSLEAGFLHYLNRSLEDAVILDYGCGWGRLIRLMYKFSPPDKIFGCDPWNVSVQICQENRLAGHLAICDYVPKEIPFPNVKFDLIYAFSVFTHLSEKTAHAVLRAIHSAVSDDGLLALTIRPADYWDHHLEVYPIGLSAQAMRDIHERHGFAFIPHNRAPIDGDITYGDTSISLDYIQANWLDWRLVGTQFNPADPYQIIIFLQPN